MYERFSTASWPPGLVHSCRLPLSSCEVWTMDLQQYRPADLSGTVISDPVPSAVGVGIEMFGMLLSMFRVRHRTCVII